MFAEWRSIPSSQSRNRPPLSGRPNLRLWMQFSAPRPAGAEIEREPVNVWLTGTGGALILILILHLLVLVLVKRRVGVE